VLRRTFIVYSELSNRLRAGDGQVEPAARADAAKLFRQFSEQYHERRLEEQDIFSEVRKAGGPNEKLVEVLLAQHQRGREIMEYLYGIGSAGRIGAQGEALARALTAMARTYEWRIRSSFRRGTRRRASHDSMSWQKFEEIAHQQFGKDGFDDTLERIARFEQTLGPSDLGFYTGRLLQSDWHP
jgi:hypothetical protein